MGRQNNYALMSKTEAIKSARAEVAIVKNDMDLYEIELSQDFEAIGIDMNTAAHATGDRKEASTTKKVIGVAIALHLMGFSGDIALDRWGKDDRRDWEEKRDVQMLTAILEGLSEKDMRDDAKDEAVEGAWFEGELDTEVDEPEQAEEPTEAPARSKSQVWDANKHEAIVIPDKSAPVKPSEHEVMPLSRAFADSTAMAWTDKVEQGKYRVMWEGKDMGEYDRANARKVMFRCRTISGLLLLGYPQTTIDMIDDAIAEAATLKSYKYAIHAAARTARVMDASGAFDAAW